LSGGHAHGLYLHGRGIVYDLPAHRKIVATVVFVLAVVLTPRGAFWAFGCYGVIVLVVARAGGVATSVLARRLTLEIPFVLFAALLPFIGGGERADVLLFSVSIEGSLSAWNIIAKATLGIAAGALLASTTQPSDLVHGLDRLRLPKVIVAISGFMVRYADLVTGEMHRMRIARESRAYDLSGSGRARVVASSAGSLFIRSYERGERVYLAMLARGFDGRVPSAAGPPVAAGRWVTALFLPAVATLVALVAVVMS
jgi:cobalt/nickel transport system permease protein